MTFNIINENQTINKSTVAPNNHGRKLQISSTTQKITTNQKNHFFEIGNLLEIVVDSLFVFDLIKFRIHRLSKCPIFFFSRSAVIHLENVFGLINDWHIFRYVIDVKQTEILLLNVLRDRRLIGWYSFRVFCVSSLGKIEYPCQSENFCRRNTHQNWPKDAVVDVLNGIFDVFWMLKDSFTRFLQRIDILYSPFDVIFHSKKHREWLIIFHFLFAIKPISNRYTRNVYSRCKCQMSYEYIDAIYNSTETTQSIIQTKQQQKQPLSILKTHKTMKFRVEMRELKIESSC